MPPPPPLWRQVFDAVERTVTPHLESLVRTGEFSRAVAVVTRAQAFAREQANEVSARLWHLVNLPAGTDVRRLRAQVGALDREVRRLTLQLERERELRDGTDRPGHPDQKDQKDRTIEEDSADAAGTEPAGRARPRPSRRRTQRPAGP
jgi:hypothetical protein